MEKKTDEDTIIIKWTVDPFSSSTYLLNYAPTGYQVQKIERKGIEAKVTYVKIKEEEK